MRREGVFPARGTTPAPTVAVTVPVRRTERLIAEVVFEAGYKLGLQASGLEAVLVSPVDSAAWVERKVRGAAGLLLTGGQDVDPNRYGEKPDGARDVSFERDRVEFDAVRMAMGEGIPVFGICRGMQLLNVALGGTLIQDLPTHWRGEPHVDHDRPDSATRPRHGLRVDSPELLRDAFRQDSFTAYSSHHQGIKDLADGLFPVCYAEDGLIEAVELRREGQWVTGVQWHPERMLEEEPGVHRRLFEVFAGAVVARATASADAGS